MEAVNLPAIGSTIYAQWSTGSITQGSGWVAPESASNLQPWIVAGYSPFDSILVEVPGGGRIVIRSGQYVTCETVKQLSISETGGLHSEHANNYSRC